MIGNREGLGQGTPAQGKGGNIRDPMGRGGGGSGLRAWGTEGERSKVEEDETRTCGSTRKYEGRTVIKRGRGQYNAHKQMSKGKRNSHSIGTAGVSVVLLLPKSDFPPTALQSTPGEDPLGVHVSLHGGGRGAGSARLEVEGGAARRAHGAGRI